MYGGYLIEEALVSELTPIHSILIQLVGLVACRVWIVQTPASFFHRGLPPVLYEKPMHAHLRHAASG